MPSSTLIHGVVWTGSGPGPDRVWTALTAPAAATAVEKAAASWVEPGSIEGAGSALLVTFHRALRELTSHVEGYRVNLRVNHHDASTTTASCGRCAG